MSPKGVANWIINELPREIGDRALDTLPFGGPELGRLVELVENNTISSSAGRKVLAEMADSGADPAAIVESRGLRQISDPAILEPIVDQIVAANMAKATEYRNGRTGLLGFFVGQVMGKTRGRANPELAKTLIEERISAIPMDEDA